MNAIDIIIILSAAAIVLGTIAYRIRKSRKEKQSGLCSSGCSGCSMEKSCSSQTKP